MKTRPFLVGWGRADFKKRGIMGIIPMICTYIKVSNAYCYKTKRYGTEGLSRSRGLRTTIKNILFYVTLKYPAIGWLEVLVKIFL